jgi:galactokinase
VKLSNDSDDLFRQHFGHPPEIEAQAPGRINLIGEHIDYLDGWVLPAAIDRHISAVAASNGENIVRVRSAGAKPRRADFPVDQLERRSDPADGWLNYIVGVLAGYHSTGIELSGFDLLLHSTLPSGAGLSSSAALETVTALVIEGLTGDSQDPVDRALICQKAEHDFAGVPCGIMDQLAVGACRENNALLIDCRDLSLKHVPLPADLALVVFDTGVKHALGDGEYRRRREDCENALSLLGSNSFREVTLEQVAAHRAALGDRLFRRARHAVTEMVRVQDFSTALESQSMAALGPLMRASHDSLRDDFEVSCRELDFLVDSADEFGNDRGLVGSRMTGGGFGGSTVSLVKREACDEFIDHLKNQFAEEFRPDYELNAFTTHAAAAASITVAS